MPTFVLIGAILAASVLLSSRTFGSPFAQLAAFVILPFCVKPLVHSTLALGYVRVLDTGAVEAALSAFAVYIGIGCAAALILRTTIRSHRRSRGAAREYDALVLPLQTLSLTGAGYCVALLLPAILVFTAISKGVDVTSPLALRHFLSSNGMFYFLEPIFFLAALLGTKMTYDFAVLRRSPPISIIVIFGVYCAIGLRSGYSGFLISMPLAALVLLSAFKSRRVWPLLVVLGPLALLHAAIYLQYRQRALADTTTTYTSSARTVLTDRGGIRMLLNRLDQMDVFVEGYHYLSDKEPAGIRAVGNVAFLMVPRAWWAEKPTTFSATMTSAIMPEVYSQGSTANYNSLNEFRYLFGPTPGLLIGSLLLGLLLFMLDRTYDRCSGSLRISVFYTLVLLTPFITGFSAGFLNEAALPMLCINYACYRLLVRFEVVGAPVFELYGRRLKELGHA
jgi:hypothetical protein